MAEPELFSALVKQLTHVMAVAFDRRLKAHNVTIAQWGILRQLWEAEGRSQVELQARLSLEGATVTGLLERMEKSGLIERRADPTDKRVQRVFLTASSLSLEPIVKQIAAEINAQALAGFSEDEQAFLLRLLRRSLRNVVAD